MRKLLGGLRPVDAFNILFFSGGGLVYSPESVSATRDNVSRAMAAVDGMQGGGGPRSSGRSGPRSRSRRRATYARSFVVVTDGYVSVEPQVFEEIKQNLGKANVFSFGSVRVSTASSSKAWHASARASPSSCSTAKRRRPSPRSSGATSPPRR